MFYRNFKISLSDTHVCTFSFIGSGSDDLDLKKSTRPTVKEAIPIMAKVRPAYKIIVFRLSSAMINAQLKEFVQVFWERQ